MAMVENRTMHQLWFRGLGASGTWAPRRPSCGRSKSGWMLGTQARNRRRSEATDAAVLEGQLRKLRHRFLQSYADCCSGAGWGAGAGGLVPEARCVLVRRGKGPAPVTSGVFGLPR